MGWGGGYLDPNSLFLLLVSRALGEGCGWGWGAYQDPNSLFLLQVSRALGEGVGGVG